MSLKYRSSITSEARRARAYDATEALVVGCGDSGAEIAVDLAEAGGAMPTPIVDAIAKALRRLTIPNLTGYGLPTPRAGRTPITRGAASSRSSTSASSVGYRTGLEPLVGHLCVLNERGEPTHHAGRTHPDAPNLHFIGCTISLGGLLRPLPGESRRIARRLASRS